MTACLATVVLMSVVAPAPAPTSLNGLWVAEQGLGPLVRGELTIEQTDRGWIARIAGFEVPVRAEAERVDLTLPGGEGELRARRLDDRIVGHWIQPARWGDRQRYATPVVLRPLSPRAWRGEIVPLDDRLSLNLWVETRADGTLAALLRNPDGHLGDGSFDVAASGPAVRLAPRGGGPPLEARLEEEAGRLGLTVPGLGTVALTRRSRTEAPGFSPRTPPGERYVYRRPLAEDDGWATASLEEAGLETATLAALVQRILDTDPAQPTAPLVQGLLVARHGRLVLEEYFHGFDKERPHDLRSASKTFASVLVGLAQEGGNRVDVKAPVKSFFPESIGLAHPDPRKDRITVEHLMTMTSGLACDENDDASPGGEDRMQSQSAQPDWHRYALDLPMDRAPGEKAVYCSAGVNLLGGVIGHATRTWLPDFFHERLAEPLQIARYHVNLMPTGEAYLGGGMYLRPRDLLKFGQLYLSGGLWHGRRILSRDWVERSTTRHPEINPENNDGYNWHLNEIKVGERSYREYEANGNGGQFLIVLPELDLAVVFTGAHYGRYGIWRRFRDELVPQFIVPAVRAP